MLDAAAPRLPALPTRKEIATYANQGVTRSSPITIDHVRKWDSEGWIKRHPRGLNPIRYTARTVLDFLNGEFNQRGRAA